MKKLAIVSEVDAREGIPLLANAAWVKNINNLTGKNSQEWDVIVLVVVVPEHVAMLERISDLKNRFPKAKVVCWGFPQYNECAKENGSHDFFLDINRLEPYLD